MPKVSVIIPVYGVEKYIEKCVRSLFEQTFDDIEYIIVNDCTKDSSMEILCRVLEEYPHRKGQVKIFDHEVNRGLMHTRRTGYKNATGDYFIFCDSDDYMPKNAVEILYSNVFNTSIDIVFSNYVRKENIIDHPSKRTLNICHSIDDVYLNLLRGKMKNYLVGNIYSCNLFKFDYEFIHNQTINEDFILLVQILSHCKEIKFIDDYLYYYVINSDSSTGSFSHYRFLQELKAIEWMLVYFKGGKYESFTITNTLKRVNNLLILGVMFSQIESESTVIASCCSWENRKKYLNLKSALYSLMLQNCPLLCKIIYYLRILRRKL